MSCRANVLAKVKVGLRKKPHVTAIWEMQYLQYRFIAKRTKPYWGATGAACIIGFAPGFDQSLPGESPSDAAIFCRR
jgi:hypothetical protein